MACVQHKESSISCSKMVELSNIQFLCPHCEQSQVGGPEGQWCSAGGWTGVRQRPCLSGASLGIDGLGGDTDKDRSFSTSDRTK